MLQKIVQAVLMCNNLFWDIKSRHIQNQVKYRRLSFFTKIVNSYNALTIFTKNSVIDTLEGYHCTSIKSLQKEFCKCSRQDTFLFAQSSEQIQEKHLLVRALKNISSSQHTFTSSKPTLEKCMKYIQS